jgi:hypothetical protein
MIAVLQGTVLRNATAQACNRNHLASPSVVVVFFVV